VLSLLTSLTLSSVDVACMSSCSLDAKYITVMASAVLNVTVVCNSDDKYATVMKTARQ